MPFGPPPATTSPLAALGLARWCAAGKAGGLPTRLNWLLWRRVAASAPGQAMRASFRYNRRMRIRSLESLAGKPVALGLMVVLAWSSTGCDALGISGKKPPPLLEGVKPAPASRSAAPSAPRRLQSFGVGGLGSELQLADPEPVAVVNPAGTPGGAGTLNGHPNGLSREALNSVIQGTMGSLATCFTPSAENPMVAVSFEADPSGRASLVRVSGAPPDAERCVRLRVQNMKFPRFEGNGVHVDLPLTFPQVGRGQAAAPSGESKEPSGPPLFLQP